MRRFIAALLAVLGVVALSCVALEVAATRTAPTRDGQVESRGTDLQRPIPPAVTRTRAPWSRSAAVVAGALGSWLWLSLSRRKALVPEPQIIWCDAAGPRGPPVRALA